MTTPVKINDKTLSLTNLNKELWPEQGIEKYHIIKYYIDISPYMLPHLVNRPLTFKRFPEGIHKPGFYQKNIPQGAPSWIKTFPYTHSTRVIKYILATGPETLAWLGNQGCLEIHTWLSSIYKINNPDFAVFDLDPPQNMSFLQLCEVALLLKEVLDSRGYNSYAKTSGKRGIQVYLPLKPIYSYKQVREFTAKMFQEVYKKEPSLTTMVRDKTKRGSKIYLDFGQNALGKTIIAPYSPRPLKDAPVSTPLEWQELYSLSFSPSSFSPSSFTIDNILQRLKEKGDLFYGVLTEKQNILPRDYTAF